MCEKCFNHSLYKTNHGEVFISNCRTKYRVSYNNIALVFGQDAYMNFFKNVEECHYVVKNDTDKSTRNVVFSTCNCLTTYCFSVLEIAELYYLLQSALIEAKIYV